MELETVILNKVTQTQKDMFSLTHVLFGICIEIRKV